LHSRRADRAGALEHPRRSTSGPNESFKACRDLEVRTLATDSREQRRIEAVPSQLHQRVGVPSRPRSIVLSSRSARKCIERGAQGGPTHRIEKCLDEHGTPFAGAHVEGSVLDIVELLCLKSLCVVGVSRMCAVGPETGEGVLHRVSEKWQFLERRGGRRLPKRTRCAGHQCEMCKPQLSILDRRDTFGEVRRV
jgi:hypothetical protein